WRRGLAGGRSGPRWRPNDSTRMGPAMWRAPFRTTVRVRTLARGEDPAAVLQQRAGDVAGGRAATGPEADDLAGLVEPPVAASPGAIGRLEDHAVAAVGVLGVGLRALLLERPAQFGGTDAAEELLHRPGHEVRAFARG